MNRKQQKLQKAEIDLSDSPWNRPKPSSRLGLEHLFIRSLEGTDPWKGNEIPVGTLKTEESGLKCLGIEMPLWKTYK